MRSQISSGGATKLRTHSCLECHRQVAGRSSRGQHRLVHRQSGHAHSREYLKAARDTEYDEPAAPLSTKQGDSKVKVSCLLLHAYAQ